MLEVIDLDVHYGDAQALWGIRFHVRESDVYSIIGSNGAGKSTILKTLAGLLSPSSGRVEFFGSRVDGEDPNVMVDLGISLVPEGRELFSQLTVLENLELGAFTKRARPFMKETFEWVAHLFPIIRERENQLAGKMSGGEQQMIAIGRGLMSKPKLLMLDEPSLGLAPLIVKAIFETITQLNAQKVTILLVEQNIHQALKIAHQAFVLKTGRITLMGKGDELLSDPEIQKAYMGTLK
ncbi:MAG TPA: ABC transporter ATP-binding protein [Thermodesulfobacteriota bacterium]|nr:ABC transporter ATP-binding protein [Thermodesulfobacteriota bacterium]